MTGGIEAVGSVVEGGLLARAVEPRAGEGDPGSKAGPGGHTHEGACLNCGTALVGPHCHQCGQQAHVHRTLGAFFHDLVHGLLHFEGKIWRTLPLLVWKPGRLTREYIDGRRASYVSPIALFLFVVFLTFAGFHALGTGIHLGGNIEVNGQKMSVVDGEKSLRAQIAAAEAQRAAALAANKPVAEIDNDIQGLRQALATAEAIRTNDWKGLARQVAPGQSIAPAVQPSNWLADTWRRARQNPDLLIYKLESDAYKYSWLLIPISVPFVWLLFPFNRRFKLYDHTVFVTYSLSFMMLALLLATVGARIGFKPLILVCVLYAPFHMHRQLRGTYGTSLLGAVARTGMLLAFAGIALALWALAIVGLILGA